MNNSQKTDGDGRDSPFFPFSKEPFSRAVLGMLVLALLGCVMARAPQTYLSEIFSVKLPIRLDAVIVIVLAPLFSFISAFLLWRIADRSRESVLVWSSMDIRVLGFLLGLLSLTFLFLLAQFFLALAPEGQCASPPGFSTLWRNIPGDLKINHCMSSASEINKDAWHYFPPVMLQAWINFLLVFAALYFMGLSWKVWHSKVRKE